MSRKKAENTEKNDFVIGLLERHSHVPTQEDQLARYTKMYLGRAVGFDKQIAEAVMPEPVMRPVEDAFSPIDAEVAAATAADDVYNDYGQPGATVAMEAIAEPAAPESATMTFDAAAVEESATMAFDAAEIEEAASASVEPDIESETGTVMMDAIDDAEGDEEGEGEAKDGDSREGENGRAKKKKRRHR